MFDGNGCGLMADVKSLTLVHLNRQDSVNDNKIAIYVVNIQPLAIVGHHLSCFIMDGTQSLGSGATMTLCIQRKHLDFSTHIVGIALSTVQR